MTTWHRHRTSVDTITAQLNGGGLTTLAGVSSITGRLRLCLNPGLVVSVPGTIDDSANRIVSLTLTSWLPTAELGAWDLNWLPIMSNGQRPIWPEEGSDRIVVHA